MSVAVDGTVIENRPDPEASARFVLPPESFARASTVVVKIIPADALPADDEVTLVRAKSPVRVSIATSAPASLEKALRAVPGSRSCAGSRTAPSPSWSRRSRAREASRPAPPRRAKALSRAGGVRPPHRPDPVEGPLLRAKAPPGTETLLQVGPEPLLLRHERTFVLLADPDENGWSSLPGFPLTVARLVEAGSAGAASGLEPRPPFVLSPEETRVARTGPPVVRAPALVQSPSEHRPLAPWAFAAAAAVMVLLGLSARRTR